jgi:hypothetical protein
VSSTPFANNSVLGKRLGPIPTEGKKEKVPAYMTGEALNRLRNAVVALQKLDDDDADIPVSLSAYVEQAVLERIERDELTYNNGQPFKQRRQRNLKTGPPGLK